MPGRLPQEAIENLKRKEWFPDPSIVDRARVIILPFCPRYIATRRTAITLGHLIIFTKPRYYDPYSIPGLALLAHELKHVEQYEIGGMLRFLGRYLSLQDPVGKEWLKVGYDLNRHPYEKEAYVFQNLVKERLKEEWARKNRGS
ncbi:MAG: DUF4157 domain-containing protein [Anaerolineae bacterium]|nr:DUF4157 domain-containing protein [Anaerolineae bacterium]